MISRLGARSAGTAVLCVLLLQACLPLSAAEFRGLWVDAFHSGIKTPEQTSELVARAKESNINALIVQVRKRGDAYYSSTIEPRASDLAGDYDSLADVIEKAHKAGIEVHAWISVYDVFADSKFYKTVAEHVVNKHPEWLMRTRDSKTSLQAGKMLLDPGIPEVRQYTRSVVMDIANRYDIDGLHLDNVRYLGQDTGYNAISLGRFNTEQAKTGSPEETDSAWSGWRREQITTLVREIYHDVTAAKPGVKVSASVFGNRSVAYDQFFQDWNAWLDEGIIDFAVPMIFALDDEAFKAAAKNALSCAHGRHVYIGQGAWRLPIDQTQHQLEFARTSGAQGVVLYSYSYLSQPGSSSSPSMLGTLRSSLFSQADTIPTLPWKSAQ